MLFHLGKRAGFDVVCDKCDFSEHVEVDDIVYARRALRVKGWRIRIESNVARMEGGYFYLCPTCREREESCPGKEDDKQLVCQTCDGAGEASLKYQEVFGSKPEKDKT